MNKTIVISLSVLIAFLPGKTSLAQDLQKETKPDQYRAVHWTKENRLQSVNSNAMIKDVNGFLWIGSANLSESELCRFDGSAFKKYVRDRENSGTINSGIILSFTEDSLHNIWIGTAKGLSRYDIKADTFTNFSPLPGSVFISLTMSPFQGTKDEIFCKEPGSVITAFNIHTLKRRKLLQLPKEVDTLAHWNTNKSFFDTRSNSIWMLTYSQQKGVLAQIFPDGKAQLYSWPCFKNHGIHGHSAEDMQYDIKRNSIWVNSDDGLLEFSLKDGETAEWLYPPDYIIRLEDLSPGSYRLVVQASNASKEFIGPEKTLLIHMRPPFWETWWFRITALALLVGSIYTLMRWRLRQKFKSQLDRSEKETQMAEMRQRTAELQQQKTELKMQALRAQMNPHFIFNSLNSINRFILQNDRAQASEYLTKFSKLVRMILQNSQAPLIALESELDSLELYLNLEAVRFNYHFDYRFIIPKDLDIEVLQVPPLILQPYVENAIWHGLMHKEEKGQLNIEVSEKDDHLYFTINDNGIGRERSKELASKTATKHKSMGLRITASRIAILQRSGSDESPVTINDLVNPDGMAAGTEVVIKMPVIYE